METSITSSAHSTLLPAISSQQYSPSLASPRSVSQSFSSKSSKASSLFGEALRFAPKLSIKLSKAKNSYLVTKCEIGDSLEEFLTKATPDKGLIRLMMCMGEALRTIAFKVRTGSCGGTSCVNSFGDEQLAVDMLANKLIFEALQQSHFCKYACSEEVPELQDMGGPVEGGFSVAFDPLDGSSIVDTNFTVGTIFGVWPGDKLTGVTGTDQVAAAIGIFGPRTTYVLALKDCPGTHEFLLLDEGKWQHVKNTTSIGEGKMFSPGNLRATTDNPHYAKLIDYYIREKYTLRYTGGMVPDVNQIIVKERGIFTNVLSPTVKAKPRLLFEVAPLGFLIEKAGGYSRDGKQSVLNKVINNLDERSQVAYGSKNEIISFEKTSSGEMSGTKSSNIYFMIGLVTTWYSSNIGVLLLNKYLLSNYGFRYPIFLTMCHMMACSLLSYIAIVWMKMVPMQTLRSRFQFMKISALSLIFCASVVGGNVSLKYLPISFNQAIGATSPFFTAVFAYIMALKRETWLTYVTLIPVVTGVIIASGGEPSFHMFGFIICIGGTAARALKSVVQGILLSSEGEKLNSMNLLLYTAPIVVVLLLPATLFMEENVFGITLALAREDTRIIWLLVFNSTLAYFVNLTNFLVTKHTSALTLQVLGNAKGAVAVVVSILIFKNPISVTGMLGYTLTVFGVILYSEAKKRAK